ncbi:hypothetical protein AJ87_04130 [Rhizobium yanglingense]|nr:hypothetical protein AJ87_04130 [Rhizobium yanglingense]
MIRGLIGVRMERLADRVILVWGFKRALLAVLAGAFAVLALPPIGFFAAMFLSFTLLVWLIDGAAASPEASVLGRLWPSFAIGWLFGFGYFVAGLWWLGHALMIAPKSLPGRCRWQSSACRRCCRSIMALRRLSPASSGRTG